MIFVWIGRERKVITLANLYIAKLATQAVREVNIVAETQDEATAKAQGLIQEGETVVETVDKGPVAA